MNQNVVGYRCLACLREHPSRPFQYTCGACGHNLDVIYDYGRIRRRWSQSALKRDPDRSLWRYRPLLPVTDPPANVSLQVGGTPLVSLDRRAAEFGRIWIKDDTRNPSGSLKDRATEVALQHAAELGKEILIAASTGNAAVSLAALAAFAQQRAVIVAPASAPEAKLIPILQHRAELILVDGSYDQAFDLVLAAAQELGWYVRNTGYNPVLSEGKKTAALEIAEQLNWRVPARVFIPVGDGCIIGGIYKGFHDLRELGWVDRIPQLVAVQARGSAAIHRALQSEDQIEPVEARTVADSIAVNFPRDGLKAIRAVRRSAGFSITVTDAEILAAQGELSARAGIFAEPAAAATWAGFLKARRQGLVGEEEEIVLLITGSGLKDVPAARQTVTAPAPISPNLDAFREALKGID